MISRFNAWGTDVVGWFSLCWQLTGCKL